MRNNVSMLGQLLGDTIQDAFGKVILQRVETIHQLSKLSRAEHDSDRDELPDILQSLSNDELLPVARAFSQFLNLENTAEQYHTVSPTGEGTHHATMLVDVLTRLQKTKLIPVKRMLQ